MAINRETLLCQLESVSAGLAVRDIIEQGTCFVFRNGKVYTYNDEIACSIDCVLSIEGAVQAKPLLDILRKLEEETIELEVKESELLVTGRRKSAGIRMDAEIALPVDRVESPRRWRKIPEDFTEAVMMVKDCAGTDQSTPTLTCLHLHPDRIEASDNYQIARYECATGLKKPVLVKRNSIQHITALDMSHIGETDNWIHFRNSMGLVLSCRRYEETFPELGHFLKFDGERLVLPNGLPEAVEKARVFFDPGEEQLKISIRPGRFRIRGQGVNGWFTEFTKIRYKGPAITFFISPDLLVNLKTRHNECEIGEGRLRVVSDKLTYITAVGSDDE